MDIAPSLELRHLSVVDSIHRTGSVTRAAHVLNLTQPAVSHALAQAEKRLGIELFRRHPRGLEPTAAGDRLAETARSILDALRSTEAALRPGADGEVDRLHLTTECYTCYHWLPTLLVELARSHPLIEVSLAPESTRRPLDALLERSVDLAIVYRTITHAEIETVPIFGSEVVAVVAPSHQLANRPYLTAEDLVEEHLLLHFEPEQSVLFTELLAPAGLQPRRVSEVQLTEGIVALAKANFGVAALARWAVAPQLASGELRALPIGKGGVHRQWSIARRRSDSGRVGSQQVIRILRTRGAELVSGLDQVRSPLAG